MAGLYHVSYNVRVEYLPVPGALDFIRPAFCLLVIILDHMWWKHPQESACVNQAYSQAVCHLVEAEALKMALCGLPIPR